MNYKYYIKKKNKQMCRVNIPAFSIYLGNYKENKKMTTLNPNYCKNVTFSSRYLIGTRFLGKKLFTNGKKKLIGTYRLL